jgi:hypothetical protein
MTKINVVDKLADEEFMRHGSPHPYYGTLWEARDLNLLDDYMTYDEIMYVMNQLQGVKNNGQS